MLQKWNIFEMFSIITAMLLTKLLVVPSCLELEPLLETGAYQTLEIVSLRWEALQP